MVMLPAPNCYVPGMILRIFVLFVCALVFLVHNDDAEILYWSKNGRTCANYDIGVAAVDFAPFVVFLP
ncbi:hypothetical protein SDC9_117214 [bioreactor metagenome]|uniref:Uncharacterized protein n=1 Tax=bioreactor metagenome TaxID=1076179 RepID=A0A645BXP3_9ZZZZ